MAKKVEVLAVKGLRRAFDGHLVLDDVNLSLKAGQICAVTGPTAPARRRCCAAWQAS